MVDITIRIETDLTWEADDLLENIDTTLYKEVGGGRVTLYAETEDDTAHILGDIQAILSGAKCIAEKLEELEDDKELWETERRHAHWEYERSVL